MASLLCSRDAKDHQVSVKQLLLLLAIAIYGRVGSAEESRISYYVAAPASSNVTLSVRGQSSQIDALKIGEDPQSIVRTSEPLFMVQEQDIVEARAYEMPGPSHGTDRNWIAVRLFFNDSFKAQVDRLYS